MAVSETQSSVLSVHLSEAERHLLERASKQGRTTLSDFVRRRALEAAEIEVLERRVVTIPAEDWERFEAWAAAPPHDNPETSEVAGPSPTVAQIAAPLDPKLPGRPICRITINPWEQL